MPRRLGQHFLRASSVEELLWLIAPDSADHFLEIGAGAGALTLPLAKHAAHVTAIEIDAGLVERLRPTLPSNVELIHADALQLDLKSIIQGGVRLVGNLPYSISSPLLRRFLELRESFVDGHLMLQQEVADRVAAPPGSKAYGVLSVFYALWVDVDVPLRFPAEAFLPPPKVGSAVLRARFRTRSRGKVSNPRAFEQLVKRSFARRRKTLENNLRDSYPNLKYYLRLVDILGSSRAETLSVEDFARLSEAIGENQPDGRGDGGEVARDSGKFDS